MDKCLTIVESKNFDSNAESDFANEQTFQTYMHKLPFWDFLKVDRLEYLSMSKDQKIAAIKKYVHAMKNVGAALNSEFIISSRKLLFLLFFVSSYSVGTFETFKHDQCFTIFTSGWCERYTVLTSLNKLEIVIFSLFV